MHVYMYKCIYTPYMHTYMYIYTLNEKYIHIYTLNEKLKIYPCAPNLREKIMFS